MSSPNPNQCPRVGYCADLAFANQIGQDSSELFREVVATAARMCASVASDEEQPWCEIRKITGMAVFGVDPLEAVKKYVESTDISSK